MKKLPFVFTLALLFIACKENKKESTLIEDISKEDITTSIYPENITKVFDAHGGIDNWNRMKTLSFTMNKPNGAEVTTTNLKTRAELIETPTYAAGFDGRTLWVNEKDGNEYKGNAKFYKGLMLYFYAMPFIVGDDGIIYEEAEPLTFEGKTYPGVLISYDAGIGESPNDQYIVYYDAETGQMQWLAYTVTYGKEEKSNKFSYIRYNDWQKINGLVLPNSLTWYNVKDGKPTEAATVREFVDVLVSEEAPENTMFGMPEGAKVFNR
ncbi:MAG: hypothetical protein HKP48_01860 [Winogradskyella sp.]|uniref:DUF6503 family protein n=1 Tax=Winogradskyella sp. TaxID=1883156 RepID=UPI0017B43A4D|nr:DUF6503 family protein [Winogradskyella sp.]MBT8243743.1 hypothetical protein [Winogradskyella sp.]NNK22064.1 hypothetical protein [Winogradskyella sp.]